MIDRTLCRYTPPRGGRLCVAAAAVLLAVGLALWAGLPGTGLWLLARVGALLPVAAGLWLAVRWLARRYTYSLEQQESGQIDFVVTEQNGYRCTVVCRVALETVTAIRQQTKGKPRTPRRSFQYLNAPRPKSALLLTCTDPGGEYSLRITPNPELHRLLTLLTRAENDQNIPNEFGKTP